MASDLLIVLVVIGVAANGSTGGDSPAPAAPEAPGISVSAEGTLAESSPAASDPGEGTPDSSEKEPEETEEDKETVKALDAELLAIYTSAEQEYNTFLALVSAEGTTDLDAYTAAKTLKNNLTDYNYRQLSSVKGNGLDEFDDYKENASLYLYVMSEVADAAMTYLDDGKTSNLSEYQEAVENVSTYSFSLAASRLTFLSASGLSDDEISSLLDTSVSD